MTTPSHAQLVADLVARFPPGQGARRGDLSRAQARALVTEYGPEAIERQLNWLDSLPASTLVRARSLVGLLRSALRDAWSFPAGDPGPLALKAQTPPRTPHTSTPWVPHDFWLPDVPCGHPSLYGEANAVAGLYAETIPIGLHQEIPGHWRRPPYSSPWWPRLLAAGPDAPAVRSFPGERGHALRIALALAQDLEELELCARPLPPSLPQPLEGETNAHYAARAIGNLWDPMEGRWLACPVDHVLWPAFLRLDPSGLPTPLRLLRAEVLGPVSPPANPPEPRSEGPARLRPLPGLLQQEDPRDENAGS